MKLSCFTYHEDYIQEWPNGIAVCLMCAARHEMAMQIKVLLLQLKMREVVEELNHSKLKEPS